MVPRGGVSSAPENKGLGWLTSPKARIGAQRLSDALANITAVFIGNRFPEVAAVFAELALDCCVG
jgi:hypothetical protein